MIPSKPDGIVSRIVKELNADYRGALYHQIYYPSLGVSKKRDMFTISGMCIPIKKRKLISQFTTGHIQNPLYDENPDKCIKSVRESIQLYFDCLKNMFKKNYQLKSKGYIFTNSGISVMISLYEKILSRVMQKHGRKPGISEYNFYLRPLQKGFESAELSDLQKIRKTATSEGARGELLNDLILKIKTETGDHLFGGETRQSQFSKEFVELERRLKELIKIKFYDSSDKEWFKKVAEPEMYGRAFKVMKKNGKQDVGEAYLFVGLGECCSLLRKHDKVFNSIFIGEDKFHNKTMLEGALSTITTLRGKLEAHYTGTKATSEQKNMLKTQLQLINKCLDQEEEGREELPS